MQLRCNINHLKGYLVALNILIKYKIKWFFKGIWKECGNWQTLLIFLLVVFALGTPVWLGYLLGIITKQKWCYAMASGCLFFWNCVPCTPFIPICLAITSLIKRLNHRR